MRVRPVFAVAAAAALVGCGGGSGQDSTTAAGSGKTNTSSGASVSKPTSFAGDVSFLKEHVNVIELGTGKGPGLVIVPEFQGRVMASTFDVEMGVGNGFINYDVVAKGEITKGMTAFGGEDRIWLGPEGGQYSIYFDQGEEQNGDNWQTPAVIDSEKFDVVSQTTNEAVFK